MNKTEIMGGIELGMDKVLAVSKAIEDACPLYTTDESVARDLDQLLALVSVLQDQVSMLKSAIDALDA